MKNLLRTEWYKLFTDKLFYMMLAVVLLVNMLVYSGNSCFQLSGYKTLNQVMQKEILTAFMTCIYGGLFIGNDFAQGTFYRGILSGKGRAEAVLAKSAVFAAAANVLLYLFPLAATIVCTVKNGWGTAISPLCCLQFCLSMLLLGCAVSALSVLAGCVFRDVGRAMGLPIVLYLLMILLLNSPYALLFARILPIGTMILVTKGTVAPFYGILPGSFWTIVLLAGSVLSIRRAELR